MTLLKTGYFLLLAFATFSLSGATHEEEVDGVYVNFQQDDMTSKVGAPEGSFEGAMPTTILTVSKGCVLQEKEQIKSFLFGNFSDTSIFLVERYQILGYCTHFSKFSRTFQVTLEEIFKEMVSVTSKTIDFERIFVLVGLGYTGDPGYFSYNLYRAPNEHTQEIKFKIFEIREDSFKDLEAHIQSSKEEEPSQNIIKIRVSTARNNWLDASQSVPYVFYRFLFLTIWSCMLIYSTVCLFYLVGIPFTKYQKESKLKVDVSFLFNFFCCACRLGYYAKNPLKVGQPENLMSNSILDFVAYWSLLVSFTSISFVYVQIIRTLNDCFLWKVRYFLWGILCLFLPISLLCSSFYFYTSQIALFLFIAFYLTFLILFQSIIIIHYGRKVIQMITISNSISGQDSSSSQAKKRISDLIVSSAVLFVLSFFALVVSSLPDEWIHRVPASKYSLDAFQDSTNSFLCFALITTITRVLQQKEKSSSTNSNNNHHSNNNNINIHNIHNIHNHNNSNNNTSFYPHKEKDHNQPRGGEKEKKEEEEAFELTII